MRFKASVLSLLLLVSVSTFAGTCGNGYSNSRKFVVPFWRVLNTDQINFPVALAFNGASFYNSYYLPDLKTVANGGQIQNTANNSISVSGPADLIFCDAASAGNALKFEVAKYSATTGLTEAYVKIPTLSHTAPTSYWIFFGNASVVTSQQDLSMWSDASYVSVYHFASLTADSAGGLTLTNTGVTPSSSSSILGDSAVFNGSASMAASSSTGLGVSNLTAEFWINPNSLAAGNGTYFLLDGNFNVGGWVLRNFNSQMDFAGNYSGNAYVDRSSSNILGSGSWNSYAETVTGTTRAMYVNGGSTAFTTPGGSPATLGTTVIPLVMGQDQGGGNKYNGNMDEVRISSTVRSADWMRTTFTNESSPSDFSIMFGPATGPRIVQYTDCSSAESVANVCTFVDNVVAGNLIVIIANDMSSTNCSAPSINTLFTDTRSTTFTYAILSDNITGTGATTCVAFGVLGSGGSEAITSQAFVSRPQSMMVYEIAGAASPSLDVTSVATGGGAGSIGTGSATATTANSILLCGFAGASSGPQFYTASFSLSDAFVLNRVSPPISGPTTFAGTGAVQFTGSGSKSCTFTINTSPTRMAAALAVIKYSPSTRRWIRRAQVY
jgi:hypothetical protein